MPMFTEGIMMFVTIATRFFEIRVQVSDIFVFFTYFFNIVFPTNQAISWPDFCPGFLTRFFARVLTRVWGTGKIINTVYRTTWHQAKTIKHKKEAKEHLKPLKPPNPPKPFKRQCFRFFDLCKCFCFECFFNIGFPTNQALSWGL